MKDGELGEDKEMLFEKSKIDDKIFEHITNETISGIASPGQYFVLAAQGSGSKDPSQYPASSNMLHVDYAELKVNTLNGTSELKNITLNSLSNDIPLESSFDMACTPKTGEGTGTGVDLQFSENGVNWYTISRPRSVNSTEETNIQTLDIKNMDLNMEYLQEYFPVYMDENIYNDIINDNLQFNLLYTGTSGNKTYEHFMESSFNHFYTYNQTVDFLKEMESKHPDIVKLLSIGKSYEGRDIWALKISNNVALEEDEPEILIVSGAVPGYALNKHILLYNIWQMLEDYERQDYYVKNLIENRQIWIVPMLNPDPADCDYNYKEASSNLRSFNLCYNNKVGNKNIAAA